MMEIGFLLALVVLICLVIVLAYRVDALERTIDAERVNHSECHADVYAALSAVQGLRQGKVLREAARRWDDPVEQAAMRDLARREYQAGGPSMPAIWMRALADEVDGVGGCDSHEHTYDGTCVK